MNITVFSSHLKIIGSNYDLNIIANLIADAKIKYYLPFVYLVDGNEMIIRQTDNYVYKLVIILNLIQNYCELIELEYEVTHEKSN